MTQYMLAVHHTGPYPEITPEVEQAFIDTGKFNERLMEEGYWVFGGGLQPRETATTVDNTAGKAVVTDGPFAESKEYLGGFWIIETPDLDVALRLATDASAACREVVEVRPFQSE